MDKDIPQALRIGVTGHRQIKAGRKLSHSIQKVLDQILQDHKGVEILLYSALAEGSDQLVATIAIRYPQINLIVPLPLSGDEYLIDFITRPEKNNFHQLVQLASTIIELPKANTHTAAYRHLGEFLIEQCDMLIALWDGEQSLNDGGTAEVVKNALDAKKRIYWIYCRNMNTGIKVGSIKQKRVGDVQIIDS